MKIKLHLLTLVLLGSITMVSAQTSNNLNELLSRLDQNHMGAITDVFSQDEIAVLRTHFDARNISMAANPQRTLTGEVFATDNTNQDFGHFQSATPATFNKISNGGAADFEGAGAYDASTGLFYLIDNAGNSYAVDPATGIYAPLGMVTPPPGESFTGLEFNQLDGKLYGISTNGTGTSTLSTIDPVTGAVTVIGDTGLVLAIAMAIDLAGAIFAYDIDTDNMYSISTTTAVATFLGSIGFDASFGQGMFLDPFTGFIYLTAFNNGAFRSELRMLNTTTGATTLMGEIGTNQPGTVQFAWAGLPKTSLGISDSALSSLKLFPNPAQDALQISSSEVIENVVVFNMLGQELIREQINQLATSISVSSLQSGTYIAKITINGLETSRPFIKQ